MIGGLKPYPSYRALVSRNLAAIPSHWRQERARVFFREVDQRSETGSEELLSVSHKTGVTPRSEKNVTMFLAESNVGHKVCQPGDIVVNTMWAWMAAVGVAKCTGLVSPSYGVYRPQKSDLLNPKYLDELLRTPSYRDEYVVRSTGITSSRLRLYPDQFLKIPLPVPPPDEQAAIIRFLDHADRRIRRYIKAKQKLIKLLEEQKQVIIHQAVTRGLDPSVKMRVSPTETGELIPAHWDVVALKRVLRRLVDCEHKTAPMQIGTDLLVVRTTAVRYGRLRLSGTYPTTPNAFGAWTQRATPEAGDVIFTREAPAGEACVVPPGLRVCLGQRTVLMKLRKAKYNSDYLVHMVYSGPPAMRIALASQGSTVGHFNMDDIANMPVFVPPLREQEAIVSTLRERLRTADAAADRAEKEISLLRELRTRLIADVVTGQLDVRAAAAALPDDPEDAEPLDEPDEPGDEDLDPDADPEAPEDE